MESDDVDAVKYCSLPTFLFPLPYPSWFFKSWVTGGGRRVFNSSQT